ncbi:hypothetical protein [Mycolicibacterium sp. P9-22]|uniref:hypothetical protein n=1 Tax=Mycolicibacterium sp. P9-22 TaxID=2024613 RepID=UPI0011ED37CA|nr:hypothetical protein [Mycolicibacterium sp. P9-22]
MDLHDRLSRRAAVSAALNRLSDSNIRDLLNSAGPPTYGIGGATQTVGIAGRPVFVKMIKLSDRELDAGPGSTGNLFDLPPWYHYGVGEGSAGFNAWREVAAHDLVSDWVTSGECSHFPMLYHWRIISDVLPRRVDDDGIDRAVKFWQNSPAVEHRLRALAAGTVAVTVFIEYVPQVFTSWLQHELSSSTGDVARVVTEALDQLLGAAIHMRNRDVVHFDTHLDNILTTGETVLVTDFGLMAAAGFELDRNEQGMLASHAEHDIAFCVAALVNAILGGITNFPGVRARNDWIQRCAYTGEAPGVPDPLIPTIRRLAPTAVVINDFYWHLHAGRFHIPLPAAALATALTEGELL